MRAGSWTDMTTLLVTYRNFANAPNKQGAQLIKKDSHYQIEVRYSIKCDQFHLTSVCISFT